MYRTKLDEHILVCGCGSHAVSVEKSLFLGTGSEDDDCANICFWEKTSHYDLGFCTRLRLALRILRYGFAFTGDVELNMDQVDKMIQLLKDCKKAKETNDGN